MTTDTHRAALLLLEDDWDHFRRLPAEQQPEWPDRGHLEATLHGLPSHDLVTADEVETLSAELSALDGNDGIVLQLGDCVEDVDTDVYLDTRRKLSFIETVGDELEDRLGRQVLTVGRIAGQHAKPRSSPHEVIEGVRLPSYRGPIINAPSATPDARRPDPARLTTAHAAARRSFEAVADHTREHPHRTVWTSHELLFIEYELNFLRARTDGHHLATTHWPWIGARTRQRGGAHLAIAAALANPVSVKIGPDTSPDDAVAIAEYLNPSDHAGHLTFIARFGAAHIDRLADVADAVRRRAPSVRWISDPMHGNTVSTSRGVKTRHVEQIVEELGQFQRILEAQRVRPAGIHLEATPDHVHECTVGGREPEDRRRYRSLLDPRLDPAQTRQVLAAWHA